MGVPLKSLRSSESQPAPPARTGPAAISRTQLLILAGLALAVVCVLGVLAAVVIANRGLLPDAPAAEPVAVQEPPAPGPVPTMTPRAQPPVGDAQPPFGTATLPPADTATPRPPTPTATLVVPPDVINRDKINQITSYVASLRGLKPLRDVPAVFLSQAQLRQKLEAEYTEQRLSSALDRDRELYVALDLLSPAVDFRKIVLDSAAQSVAGFYTPEEQVLYVIAESVNMFAGEEIVYAHEYTHALQDQHFGLKRFLSADMNADQAIAARALAEGDATLVMGAYEYTNITNSEMEYMAYRAAFVKREVIDAASPALGVLTFFPYLQGTRFVFALWADGQSWSKVNAAYNAPPASSEQVMHPEKYLAHDAPRAVTLPDLGRPLGEGWREVDRNTLGEIGLLAWLSDHLDQTAAAEGAAGWGGDAYTLWMDEQGHQVLAVKSVWDTPSEAAQFYQTFGDYVTHRSLGVPRLTLDETDRRLWEYEGRATFLARAGDGVLIILAPDRAMLERVRGAFPEF
jgi:hypothetical protein